MIALICTIIFIITLSAIGIFVYIEIKEDKNE